MQLIKHACIQNGRIAGTHEQDILMADGKILQIAPSIQGNGSETVIDARGKFVCPGFIDSLNVWGGQGPGWEDKDLEEHSQPVTPQMKAVHAFDHDGMLFQRVFEYGVTAAGLSPGTGNVVAGQVAVFKTFGKRPGEMLVKEAAGMRGSMTGHPKQTYGKRQVAPMTRMGIVALLQELIHKTETYLAAETQEATKVEEAAFAEVVRGEMPLMIQCNTRSEFEAVSHALKPYGIRIIPTGAYGLEADGTLEAVPGYILGHLTEALQRHRSQVNTAAIEAQLQAGKTIAISNCGDLPASGKESLLWNAMLYHRLGLSWERVLWMITEAPAKLLGVDHRLGQIVEGLDADVLIWSENPITHYAAKLEHVYVGGVDALASKEVRSCW